MAQVLLLLACLAGILLSLYTLSPYLVLLLAIGILWLTVKALLRNKRDRLRGWRVRFVHAGSLHYEEFHDGQWWFFPFGSKRLTGKSPDTLIYLPTLEDLERGPNQSLVKNRREEIIARIKCKLTPPHYTYGGD